MAAALPAFLAWVDQRARREPALAAYVLAGLSGAEHRRAAPRAGRRRAAGHRPRPARPRATPSRWQLRRSCGAGAARGGALAGRHHGADASEAWTLRELLAEAAPAEVAASLEGLDDETAWALRDRPVADRAPRRVLASLALLDGPRAWEMRERWLDLRERRRPDRACDTYDRARARLPRPSPASTTRRPGRCARRPSRRAGRGARLARRADQRQGLGLAREGHLDRAPKAVLSTIAGIDDPRAWRCARRPRTACREALDSMAGLDHPIAWDMRAACLDIWPANDDQEPGRAGQRRRAGTSCCCGRSRAHPDNISLLKQAAAIAIGGHLHPNVLAA